MKMKTEKIIQKAALWGIALNLILSILKVLGGLEGNSLALVSDGVDSFIDVFIFVLSFFISKLIAKPPTPQYPFGYKRAEAVASKAFSFFIFFVGAQFLMTSIEKIISHSNTGELNGPLVISFAGFSILIKFLFGRWLSEKAKSNKSSLLKAAAINMQGDVLISASVILSSIIQSFLKVSYIDSICALIISIWILKTAFEIFKETSMELMDGIDDPEIYEQIFSVIERFKAVQNPHRVRLRKIGVHYSLSFDVEVDGNKTIYAGHDITKEIETALKEEIDSLVDIVIHLEPLNNYEPEESYGLNKESLPFDK